MTRPVVADTGPLIALARVERLELLQQRYGRVVVPPAVHAELALDSDGPGARVLSGAFNAGWLTVGSVTNSGLVRELARLLDPGEAEAIALAEQEAPPAFSSSTTREDDGSPARATLPSSGSPASFWPPSPAGRSPLSAPFSKRFRTPHTVSPLASLPGCSSGRASEPAYARVACSCQNNFTIGYYQATEVHRAELRGRRERVHAKLSR